MRIFWIALLIHLIAAIFSQGFFHPDEHYFALDFGYSKLGLLPDMLANWEWQEKLRAWFLPALFYPWMKLFQLAMAPAPLNPFVLETCLRVFSAFMALLATWWWCKKEKLPLHWPLFFWPLVFMHARTSSENWSVIFLLISLSFLHHEERDRETLAKSVWSGIFAAAAFWCRFQIGFMLLGLGFHLFFVVKRRKTLLSFSGGFLFLSVFALLLDRWGYDLWVFTPWEYLRANLLENKIAQFGTSPWWSYFWQATLKLTPLYAIPLLAALFLCWKKHPKHQWTWMTVPFLLFHLLIGHKELRFLYPLLPFALGSMLFLWPKTGVLHSGATRFFWYINLILLVFVMFRPANSLYGLYKALWEVPSQMVVQAMPDQEGRHLSWERKALLKPGLTITNITSAKEIQLRPFWLIYHQRNLPESHLGQCQIQFSTYPEWLLTNSMTRNLLKRSAIWSLAYCP